MRRTLSIVVPLVLFIAACGGDDGGSAATMPSTVPAAEAADSGSGTDDGTGDAGGNENGTGPDVDADADEAAVSGDTGSAYCRMFREFEDSVDVFEEATSPLEFDGDVFRVAFDVAATMLDEIVAVAPDEIRDDIVLQRRGFGLLRDELEAVDFNLFAVDPTSFFEIQDELDDAWERIEEYNESVCGIPRVGTDIEIDLDGFDLDGFDLNDLGEFGDLLREGMLDGFVGDGLSPAQAECVVDALLDLDFTSDAEMIDPFELCGISFDQLDR